MKTYLISIILGTAVLSGCDNGTPELEQGNPGEDFAKYGQEFKGKIAKSYEDSEEWWPEKKRPPADAPNVIIFLLDDVGFAQVESFGGLIETPNIDALAENGLRFNNFHNCYE